MHRLDDFVVRRVLPDLEALNQQPSGDAKSATLRSRLTESLLWLHLGAEIGSFPQQASNEVYEACFRPFVESLSSQETGQMRIYVAHSRESGSLILSFPRYVRILIERAMRGEEIVSIERCEFSSPQNMRASFQVLLIMGIRVGP